MPSSWLFFFPMKSVKFIQSNKDSNKSFTTLLDRKFQLKKKTKGFV